jgi:hypothetical protein
MHLIGHPRAFRRDVPASTKSGVRPATHHDAPHCFGGALPELSSTQIAPLALIRQDWVLYAVEVEDLQPRLMHIRVGSNLENLEQAELLGLYEIAGTGQFTSLDDLPLVAARVAWRRRERQTDPDVEMRAADLRRQISTLQAELTATEALLAEQASGEYDKRLAAEAEKLARDRAAIAENNRLSEERRWQRERARRAGKAVLERLGAQALGMDPDAIGIQSAQGPGDGINWEAVAAQKAKDAARTKAKTKASAAEGPSEAA